MNIIKTKTFILIFIMTLVLLFSTSILPARAQAAYTIPEFTDIAEQSPIVKTAIMKLAVLGVMQGDGGIGGTFRPNDNLTRVEFAKLACYFTGDMEYAQSLNNTISEFKDIPTGTWYTGFVNMVGKSGFFRGDTDGNFHPEANITMQEVVTVLLRIAGYNDHLGSVSRGEFGIWPTNYIDQAASLGVLDDVNLAGGDFATRADVAAICGAMLDIQRVDWVTQLLGGDYSYEEYFSPKRLVINDDETKIIVPETMLYRRFSCKKLRATFAANGGFDEISIWGDYFSPGSAIYEKDFKFITLNHINVTMAFQYYIRDGLTLPDLAGLQADVIVNNKDEIIFVEAYPK